MTNYIQTRWPLDFLLVWPWLHCCGSGMKWLYKVTRYFGVTFKNWLSFVISTVSYIFVFTIKKKWNLEMTNWAPFSMYLLSPQFRFLCLHGGWHPTDYTSSLIQVSLWYRDLFLVVPATLQEINEALVPVQKAFLVLYMYFALRALLHFYQ